MNHGADHGDGADALRDAVQDQGAIELIVDAQRSPFEGIGKPEPLKENLAGFWSRRIDETNRLVYAVDDGQLTIIACRYHYEK
jgi:toxin YoeB